MYTKNSNLGWGFNERTVTIKDESSGLYFPLDTIGSLIWDMLDGTNSLEKIATTITTKYAVSFEEALSDVNRMVDNFLEYELLEGTP